MSSGQIDDSKQLDKDALRMLFRRTASSFGVLSEEKVVPLDAAMLDVAVASDKIFSKLLPRIREESHPDKLGDLLDDLMELKHEMEHVQFHLEHGISALRDLMAELAHLEETRDSP